MNLGPFKVMTAVGLSLSCLLPWRTPAQEPQRSPDPVTAARELIAQHEATIRPLEKASALAWWSANATGETLNARAFAAEFRGRRP